MTRKHPGRSAYSFKVVLCLCLIAISLLFGWFVGFCWCVLLCFRFFISSFFLGSLFNGLFGSNLLFLVILSLGSVLFGLFSLSFSFFFTSLSCGFLFGFWLLFSVFFSRVFVLFFGFCFIFLCFFDCFILFGVTVFLCVIGFLSFGLTVLVTLFIHLSVFSITLGLFFCSRLISLLDFSFFFCFILSNWLLLGSLSLGNFGWFSITVFLRTVLRLDSLFRRFFYRLIYDLSASLLLFWGLFHWSSYWGHWCLRLS